MELPKNYLTVEEAFLQSRERLNQRLQKLENPYHNQRHAENVQVNLRNFLDHLADENLVTDRQKVMLLESALRHDDGHVGVSFRQDVSGDDLSNEEYAVQLLEDDLGGKISEEDLRFMKEHILATAFGQSNKDILPEGKKHYFREYGPKTDTQKLLALADIGYFLSDWDTWLENEQRFYIESKQMCPETVDTWITSEENFILKYIKPLLSSVQHVFEPEYFEDLKSRLDNILSRLHALKSSDNPERMRYQERLDIIRGVEK